MSACTRRLSKSVPADFARVFATLKAVLAAHAKRLSIKTDGPVEYTLVTKRPSPFPQHKGQPNFFGSVRLGKAYVSFHLMPLYMNATLANTMSPDLKRRMQGKSCFNFKNDPNAAIVAELKQLTGEAIKQWSGRNWV
jgi:hypothetical protein